MNKTNKGITLVALVITIIVLIILAGVSINAVMNDGLIENSKEARNEFEMAKENETGVIGELYQETEGEVLRNYFEKNKENLTFNYQISHGFFTGVYSKEKDEWLTVETLCNDLDGTYEVWNKDNTEKLSDDEWLTTGHIIKRNGEIIARVVEYGNIDGLNGITSADPTLIGFFLAGKAEVEDYQKVAMDVTHDGIINQDDVDLISNFNMNSTKYFWLEDVPAPDPDTIIVEPIVTE